MYLQKLNNGDVFYVASPATYVARPTTCVARLATYVARPATKNTQRGKKLFDAEGLFLVLGDNAFCPFCVFLLFRWDLKIIFA